MTTMTTTTTRTATKSRDLEDREFYEVIDEALWLLEKCEDLDASDIRLDQAVAKAAKTLGYRLNTDDAHAIATLVFEQRDATKGY